MMESFSQGRVALLSGGLADGYGGLFLRGRVLSVLRVSTGPISPTLDPGWLHLYSGWSFEGPAPQPLDIWPAVPTERHQTHHPSCVSLPALGGSPYSSPDTKIRCLPARTPTSVHDGFLSPRPGVGPCPLVPHPCGARRTNLPSPVLHPSH